MIEGDFSTAFARVKELAGDFQAGKQQILLSTYSEAQTRSLLLPKHHGDFYEPSYIYFKDFPIRTINFADENEKAKHDKMVALVEQMLEAKRLLQAARSDRDITFYQDRCGALDRQIDRLVYDLYDLAPEEIEIVEGKS